MQPDHALLARKIADYFGTKGYQRIAVVQERSDAAHELAGLLTQVGAGRPGIRTAATMTFAPGAGDPEVRRLAVDVARLAHPDAVFLAGNRTDSLRIYRELRRRGVTAPVYGGQDLDIDTFWTALQQWRLETGVTAGFSVPTVTDFQSGVALRFARTYAHTYGRAPQRLSALGYDAVKLVVQGLILAKAGVLGEAAATPLHVADELRYMHGCIGAAGSYRFFDDGNLRDKAMFIKALVEEPTALPGAREAARPRAAPGALSFSFNRIRPEADLGLPECGDLNQHSDTPADKPAHEERP
jgi:ABC-type branched-subunit amino acid transport system substrate-binding protein